MNFAYVVRVVLASLNRWFADKFESQPDASEVVLQNFSDETTKGGFSTKVGHLCFFFYIELPKCVDVPRN